MPSTQTDPSTIFGALDHDVSRDELDALGLSNRSCCVLAAARKGMGKTSALMNIMGSKAHWRRRFDAIFYVSPTAEREEKTKRLYKECQAEGNAFDTYSDAVIDHIIEVCSRNKADKKARYLCILDDCVNSLPQKRASKLAALVMNSRHLGLSVYLATQAYNQVPLPIRKQMDVIMVWPTGNAREYESVLNDVSVPEELFQYMYAAAMSRGPFSFLTINMCAHPIRFYAQFTPLPIPSLEELAAV